MKPSKTNLKVATKRMRAWKKSAHISERSPISLLPKKSSIPLQWSKLLSRAADLFKQQHEAARSRCWLCILLFFGGRIYNTRRSESTKAGR